MIRRSLRKLRSMLRRFRLWLGANLNRRSPAADQAAPQPPSPPAERDRSVLEGQRIAIIAIVKNEAPYLLEWIAYHRVIGINDLYISDDGSNDGTEELLQKLADSSIIRRLPPPPTEANRQLAVYKSAMDSHRNEFDWVAFTDVDEFILPDAPTLKQALSPLLLSRDVGAIGFNWATYGSSGLELAGPQPVIERFGSRGPVDWSVNQHMKVLVRSDAFRSVGKNPHYFELNSGYAAVHPDGTSINYGIVPGLSSVVIWDRVRINHYVIKSRREFIEKKMYRGRADRVEVAKDMSYFDGHDRNDESDPIRSELLSMTKEEVARIESAIG